jgi:hypothetical protein
MAAHRKLDQRRAYLCMVALHKDARDGGDLHRSESLKILLSQMFRDELGHLEHTHLALTIEYRPE